ncbi:hypothetical protein C8R42DRAFT_645836 [Lentinula raphanica]|nr:hypothetical protein C8R42DRAFT_645836 [Lentinula raphanica]
MAEPHRANFFGSHLLTPPFWDPNLNGFSFFGLTFDSTREEVKATLFELGLFLCFMVIMSVYIFSVLAVFYHVTMFAGSWIYEHMPCIRNKELERREKELEQREKELEQRERALELKESMVARQARTLALDVDIGVCNHLVKILKHSLTATEVRKLELENERVSLLPEATGDDHNAMENGRRSPALGSDHQSREFGYGLVTATFVNGTVDPSAITAVNKRPSISVAEVVIIYRWPQCDNQPKNISKLEGKPERTYLISVDPRHDDEVDGREYTVGGVVSVQALDQAAAFQKLLTRPKLPPDELCRVLVQKTALDGCDILSETSSGSSQRRDEKLLPSGGAENDLLLLAWNSILPELPHSKGPQLFKVHETRHFTPEYTENGRIGTSLNWTKLVPRSSECYILHSALVAQNAGAVSEGRTRVVMRRKEGKYTAPSEDGVPLGNSRAQLLAFYVLYRSSHSRCTNSFVNKMSMRAHRQIVFSSTRPDSKPDRIGRQQERRQTRQWKKKRKTIAGFKVLSDPGVNYVFCSSVTDDFDKSMITFLSTGASDLELEAAANARRYWFVMPVY